MYTPGADRRVRGGSSPLAYDHADGESPLDPTAGDDGQRVRVRARSATAVDAAQPAPKSVGRRST